MSAAHPEASLHRVDAWVWRAAPEENAGALRQRLQQASAAQRAVDWGLVCVVEADGRLIGTLSPVELLGLPDATPLAAACHRDVVRVPAGTDQERLASIALDRDAVALPLVDEAGRLVGVVGPRALMDVLRREHVEDLHRLAGVARESAQARHALEDPPLRRARHRLPWLLVGLLGSALATWLMSRFESALTLLPALAFFVPGIVYLADAVGTQSEAVAVRGLSLSHAGLRRLLGGELRTGLLLGGLLGALALAAVWVLMGQPRLALAVGLALAGACSCAALLGLLLPWTIGRLGLDPAYGAGPLATIAQDLLSLAIYLGCVKLLLL